jgi:predicted hydrolase (HD superfamily)
VEIKRKAEIGEEVADEVQTKVEALGTPRGTTVRTALVYEGSISPRVEADGYFDFLIPAERLFDA